MQQNSIDGNKKLGKKNRQKEANDWPKNRSAKMSRSGLSFLWLWSSRANHRYAIA
jgi:hypothetical protein